MPRESSIETGIQIRTARPSEAGLLSNIAFASKASRHYDQGFMDACRAELTYLPSDLTHKELYFGLAESAVTVLGFVALKKLPNQECELEALFVLPDWTGKGVGQKLLGHASSKARCWGCTKLLIQSDPFATGFYEAMGAKQIGYSESGSVQGRMLPVLKLNLDQFVSRDESILP